jgi:hypothetical protein
MGGENLIFAPEYYGRRPGSHVAFIGAGLISDKTRLRMEPGNFFCRTPEPEGKTKSCYPLYLCTSPPGIWLADIQTEIKTLGEAKANNEALINSVKGNGKWLFEFQQKLFRLAPSDKKRFVVSLVSGKIKVSIGSLEEREKGPERFVENYGLSFNPDIFETPAGEKKIRGLPKNDPNHSSAPRPNPLEPGQDLSGLQGYSPE